MGSFSDYAEAKILDQIFGGTAWTPPATLYFALFTANPSDSGGGTEVTGGSYARAAVTNNGTNFTGHTGTSPTQTANSTAINFTTPTADWGTVTAMGVFDASTSGNLVAWAPLTTSKVIQNGDPVSFAIGAFVLTLD